MCITLGFLLYHLFIPNAFSYNQFVKRGVTIATSSTTLPGYVTSRAVDGNYSQHILSCSHTDARCNIVEAWLRIDLRRVYSIKSVKFWYRTDRTDGKNMIRLPGYSILVSIESWPNSSCYRDPISRNLPSIIVNECKATTRYIWFYQSHVSDEDCAPMLEICEVQIYGCNVGNYGEDCSKICGLCKSGTCDIETGLCDSSGCIHRGFQAPTCKECVAGLYGLNCTATCSTYCKNITCDRSSGTCLEGCANGYTGDHCNETCQSWKYGENCLKTCGNCFQNLTCHHINGTCINGCQEGFRGQLCQTTCMNGTFGKDCMQNCSGNCLDLPCNKTNGMCTQCLPGWMNDFCTERLVSFEQLDKDGGPSLVVIVGSAIGLVVIIVTVIVIIAILRRRHNGNRKNEDVNMQEIYEEDYEEDTVLKDNETDNVYYNQAQIYHKDIKISDIFATIQRLEKDSDKEFLKEFKSIPYGERPDKLCSAGRLPGNIPKNRFKTTFPYDHSRIILRYQDKSGDYINANFIKNTYKTPAYIASQGPKSSTIGDFWQMVWQEDIYVIAMVTNLSEGGKIKCVEYWPENIGSQIKVDKMYIQLESEKTYSSFLLHQLRLTNEKTKETRQITHLQYTAWPDHGTPNPLELLVYHQYVTKAMKEHPEHKLLVHCSAGIGRTGTFIALDALYQHGIKEDKINIVEYVNTMREDRMNMIQNLDQYKFLYRALYESFRVKSHLLTKETFVQEVESLMSSNKAVNFSSLRTQFKELESLKPDFEEKEKTCGQENISLNMTRSVLPADKIRIILSSHVKGRGTYYNAIPVSTFTTRDCIITGQYPVPGAAVDLIRLLVDQECSTLISTGPLSEVPSSNEWFCSPPGGSFLFQYQIQVDTSVRVTDNIMKSNIRIKPPATNNWHDVTLFEVTTWTTKDNVPCDCRILLNTIVVLQQNEKVDAENKIAILSRDGASRCGEFCAVYNAIEQLQQDQEVDMFTIVRQLQRRRPEMISHLEEYMSCCQAVLQFIKQTPEEVYMNYQITDENVYANA